MTQEENRLKFKERMMASGRMPMTDQVRKEKARAEAKRADAFCGRPEGLTDKEWDESLRRREAFKKRMQAGGRLPKDSDLLLCAKEELRIEQQHREQVERIKFDWETEREAMRKQYDEKIANLEEQIKKIEANL